VHTLAADEREGLLVVGGHAWEEVLPLQALNLICHLCFSFFPHPSWRWDFWIFSTPELHLVAAVVDVDYMWER
jgi:hypothetical protein